MPSKGPDGKRLSGAAQQKKKRGSAQALTAAAPAVMTDFKPPPVDDLELQLWGARCAATLAYIAMTASEWRQARECLATLGLLFPRAELIKRAQKELKRRAGQEEEEELKPLEGINPGPASRFGRGAAGRGKPVP